MDPTSLQMNPAPRGASAPVGIELQEDGFHDEYVSISCRRDSVLSSHSSDGYLSEPQVGGGPSATTPKRPRREKTPPQLTPTRLRSVIHRSDRDAGSIISNAQDRRAKLLQEPIDGSQLKLPPPPLASGTSGDQSCGVEPHELHPPPKAPPRPLVPTTNVIPPTPNPPRTSAHTAPTPPRPPVLTTNVIPPTPNPPRTSTHTAPTPPPLPKSSGDAAAMGRLSEHNRKILAAGFDKLELLVQTLANDTALPINQILALWDKRSGRETKLGNVWNIYEAYLKDPSNQQDEVLRAGLNYRKHSSSPTYVSYLLHPAACQITNDVRKQCFARFKAAYPDSWSSILEAWQEVQSYEAPGQTVAQRARAFNKFTTQLIQRVFSSSLLVYHSTNSSLLTRQPSIVLAMVLRWLLSSLGSPSIKTLLSARYSQRKEGEM
jgi:hypothetical protein